MLHVISLQVEHFLYLFPAVHINHHNLSFFFNNSNYCIFKD